MPTQNDFEMFGLNKNKGFTLIEILMVILLISILALMGITQFTNFSAEAKDSALKSNLQVFRRGIAMQNAQMRLRCGVTSSRFPPVGNVARNDITAGDTPCTTTQVASAQDRVFVSVALPANPWGQSQSNSVESSTVASVDRQAKACDGSGRADTDDGWCYDETTGELWANSAHNTGAATGGTEASF